MTSVYKDKAEEKIRATGERGTPARIEILAALLASPKAVAHVELENRFHEHINRVTIYRVLDWLTEKQLAHRIAGEDRVWRFTASDEELHQHAHFQCEQCGQVVCLDQVNLAFAIALPEGYRSHRIDMTVRGDCAKCRPA
jgi:Fur family ferric uptake transcriptional regulator